MNDPIISVHGLSKQFGNFIAVDRITFDVGRGEIFGFLAVSYTHLTLPTTPYV